MSGFGALLRKELRETLKTWRTWVLGGVLVFSGISSPAMAAALPYILEWSERQGSGISISVPEPTARDACVQFVSNLQQLVLLTVIVTAAGLVSSELRSGSAALTLAKPISRAAFVVGKLSAYLLHLLTATALGTALCVGATAILFGAAPLGDLLQAVALWLAYALLLTCFTVLLSCTLRSQLGVAALGIATFIALSALSLLQPLAQTPVGMADAVTAAMAGTAFSATWPLVASVALALVLLATTLLVFQRKEI